MELGVELLPELLDEAKFAELGENRSQEILLVDSQVIFCNLQKHRLSLAEVTPCYLAKQEGQKCADAPLGWLSKLSHIFEDEAHKMVFNLALELFHGLNGLRLLNKRVCQYCEKDGLSVEGFLRVNNKRKHCCQEEFG